MSRLDKVNFVVFNGPPESGKTTAANWLCTMLANKQLIVQKDSFAAPMKRYLTVALNMSYEDIKKDIPMAVLSGNTPRQFLISESEDHMKPKYGPDIFGRLLHYRALPYQPLPNVIVVDDSGFVEELQSLGEYEPILVRIRRVGMTFERDSRSYLPNPAFEINNDGDLDWLHGAIGALSVQIYNA